MPVYSDKGTMTVVALKLILHTIILSGQFGSQGVVSEHRFSGIFIGVTNITKYSATTIGPMLLIAVFK